MPDITTIINPGTGIATTTVKDASTTITYPPLPQRAVPAPAPAPEGPASGPVGPAPAPTHTPTNQP